MTRSLSMQQDQTDEGLLQVNVNSLLNSRAVENAKVQITESNNPEHIIEELTTDANGQSDTIELPTPPLEYSMIPGSSQPYAEYNLRISAPGYETTEISGAELLSGQKALQNVSLLPLSTATENTALLYVIPPHTLYGDYPPKIEENEIKDVSETGEIVLSRVVIPSGVR